jgi:predicted subunit of tRNA(5-methylaminomethyl-2-thiouridylate) methyltransferase
MTKVFEHAQQEITKTKKFKILSLEINAMHRAIALLVEKGFPMDSIPVVTLEKQLCSLTRVRGWCLRK